MMAERKWRACGLRALALVLVAALVAGVAPFVARADEAEGTALEANYRPDIVKRLWGDSRYHTMFKIVDEGFRTSEWAVITSGENYPDALAASALAGALKCPIIITEPNRLSGDASEQLKTLKVSRAYIVGGEVSESVAAEISGMGIKLSRVVGRDRVATSLAVMEEVRGVGTASNSVIIATGASYADALSIGPWAYATATPIVLANADGTLGARATELIKATPEIGRVILIGGKQSVSDEVTASLGTPYVYLRLEGKDRYETSARIAEFVTSQGLSWRYVGMASGDSYPDALCGSALMGRLGGPVLLVSNVADPPTQLMLDHRTEARGRYIFGGLRSVSAIYDNTDIYAGSLSPIRTDVTETTNPTAPVVGEETAAQRYARERAQSYLRWAHFSRDGLISQLEYEGILHDDAVYGVDSTGTDWFDQASKSATSYMKWANFTRERLVEQLLFEKFTKEQAEYGADHAGVTWGTTSSTTTTTTDKSDKIPAHDAVTTYIINKTNTNVYGKHVFHIESCGHLPNPENREYRQTTYDALVSEGYDPCDFCLK